MAVKEQEAQRERAGWRRWAAGTVGALVLVLAAFGAGAASMSSTSPADAPISESAAPSSEIVRGDPMMDRWVLENGFETRRPLCLWREVGQMLCNTYASSGFEATKAASLQLEPGYYDGGAAAGRLWGISNASYCPDFPTSY